MYILLTAATRQEIQPVLDALELQEYSINGNEIEVLTTGVGGIATTYYLTFNINNRRPDLIIQAGIAGSFSELYPIGSVVLVGSESFGDLGVEEPDGFRDIFDLNLHAPDHAPFKGKELVNADLSASQGLPIVKAVSVNEISTSPAKIRLLKEQYGAQIESMEGAAFHYVCLQEGIPFVQIRAISNDIGERDKSKWNMQQAIANLNSMLIRILNELTENEKP